MSGFWITLFLLLLVAAIVIAVLAALYKKSTREVSLIRTGLGGERVILAAGAIALPYFHEVTEVNMRTLRLEVVRTGNASLITQDKLRIDIGASFSVAVRASEESISRAAQTLGDRTFNPEKLKEVVEGKLIDALRAVAAQMTMDQIHEGRATFVADVRTLIADDLAENGLHLQSVSLTSLDQTPFSALDENNAFNAVGMRKLAEVIATSKKERAEIDASAEVAVRLSSMEATRRKLEIEQQEEQARIAQNIEIESLRAGQTSDIAERRAAAERAAEAARIAKEQAVREAELLREKTVRNARSRAILSYRPQKSRKSATCSCSSRSARSTSRRSQSRKAPRVPHPIAPRPTPSPQRRPLSPPTASPRPSAKRHWRYSPHSKRQKLMARVCEHWPRQRKTPPATTPQRGWSRPRPRPTASAREPMPGASQCWQRQRGRRRCTRQKMLSSHAWCR